MCLCCQPFRAHHGFSSPDCLRSVHTICVFADTNWTYPESVYHGPPRWLAATDSAIPLPLLHITTQVSWLSSCSLCRFSGANAGDDGYDTLKPVEVHTIGMHQTILLVDDDPQIRALCRTTLEETGYFVSEASNGKEALEAIKETVFDLIVLDLCMPDQDGFEFLHAVRAELPKLKIIVISGFMTGTLLPVARLQGAVATLAKPFSPDSLLSAVSDVLGTKDPVGASD